MLTAIVAMSQEKSLRVIGRVIKAGKVTYKARRLVQ